MKFEVLILGCGAAAPSGRNLPSAQLINLRENYLLVDCGEGPQLQLRRYKVKFQRISHIFISHLHGDHYLGLMGLLSSMHLLGRRTPLTVYSPPGLEEIIRVQMKISESFFEFPLEFIALTCESESLIVDESAFEVRSFPLKHRVKCSGFVFSEKPLLPNISKDMIREYKLDVEEILQLKHGHAIVSRDGIPVTPEQVLAPPQETKSYAYCSDTVEWEKIIPFIRNVSLLYHESTFLHSDLERAVSTFHSTAKQDAQLAKKAGAQKLLIGHFSARYPDLQPLLQEAQSIFPNTDLALEGSRFAVEQGVREVTQ